MRAALRIEAIDDHMVERQRQVRLRGVGEGLWRMAISRGWEAMEQAIALGNLRIEAIGDDLEDQLRSARREMRDAGVPPEEIRTSAPRIRSAWVAEIRGRSRKYGLARAFIRGKKDYSEANSVGSRGVYIYYFLEPGRYYEVSEPRSWRHTERYFAKVRGGKVVRVDEEELEQWLARLDEAGVETFP